MNNDCVSKRTRNAFREFLVRWTLREIEIVFENAHVACDRNFTPEVGGQRRAFVEQHYHTMDFGNPADVRRLLSAFAEILERAEKAVPNSPGPEEAQRALAELISCLTKDGLVYRDGTIAPATPEATAVLRPARAISEVTRRAILDEMRVGCVSWSGKLTHGEFLGRLYDLSTLPSHDGRFASMADDVWQHTERNSDWDDGWVFSDPRLDLVGCPDEAFLRFLCGVLHPAVRPDSTEARALATGWNAHLLADGWELVEGPAISGKPAFVPARRASGAVSFPEPTQATDVLSDEYVRELSAKCDTRLAAGDLDGAVTVGRTFLEAVLDRLEVKSAGTRASGKDDLPSQFRRVTKLLRMDEERKDLDENFKQVVRGLVQVVNGLAPIRNKMSDGHARERKPAVHHARVIVNAAKTVAAFLVESYIYQRDKGLLPATGKAARGPS